MTNILSMVVPTWFERSSIRRSIDSLWWVWLFSGNLKCTWKKQTKLQVCTKASWNGKKTRGGIKKNWGNVQLVTGHYQLSWSPVSPVVTARGQRGQRIVVFCDRMTSNAEMQWPQDLLTEDNRKGRTANSRYFSLFCLEMLLSKMDKSIQLILSFN